MEEYLENALIKATDKFWSSITESYPDIQTGDISPNDSIAFDRIKPERSSMDSNREI